MDVNIIEILKIGFSGLAFLLALLAFRLLAAEQKREAPRAAQLNAIYIFMMFSIVLGVMAAVTPFLPKLLEEKPNLFMEAMLESAKNRKPLPMDFVQSQISTLTTLHEKRTDELYRQRDEQEERLRTRINSDEDVREIQWHIRRIDQYIRQENSDFNRKISNFRSML